MDIITDTYKQVDPYFSVMIPMFRSYYIGWVCLESLIRQQGEIPPWELIIAEEQDDETFGLKMAFYYYNILKKLNCVRLIYISLSDWIPLSNKISVLINNAHPKSQIFINHAADYYSSPMRFIETVEAFKDPKVVWFIPPKIYKYHILYNTIILVDKSKMVRKDDTSGKALRASLARNIVYCLKDRDIGIDGLIRIGFEKTLGHKINYTINKSGSWQNNLCIDGMGTLSNTNVDKLFAKRIKQLDNAYSYYPRSLSSIIPASMVRRVLRLKNDLNKHNPRRRSW